MSRDNGKKYPRTIESKNSYLRIRAPEHLDVALEGLIRKVLKEQPKMDDIYQFAADYFDMLLKLREKSGIRKLSIQDICPQHNEEDANEMIKLASTFTKRKKELKSSSRSYRAVSIKQGDHRHERKGPKIRDGEVTTPINGERFNTVLPIVNENPELEDVKPVETVVKREKSESEAEESELDFVVDTKSQDSSEKIVEAREVILEEDEGDTEESGIGTVGDISEIRDKIKVVENEIKSLEKRESEVENEGNTNDETVEEVKAEVEDVNTSETTPIVEEPLHESEDTKPAAESEVAIQEVTGEDDTKEAEEENANAGDAEEGGTESVPESTVEGGQEADNAVQEAKEEHELEAITEETEGKKDDETPTEEVHETAVEQAEEASKVEETAQEGTTNEEVAVEETAEGTTNEEVAVEETAEGTTNDEAVVEEMKEAEPVTTVEATQESEPDTAMEQMQEATDENTKDEVTEQETPQETQDSDVQGVEATEEPPKSDEATESPQTELGAGDKEEEAEAKPEVEGAEEATPDTNVKEEDAVEETKPSENEDTTEVDENEDSIAVEARSLDPAEAKEVELMGGDAPKDVKTVTEDFINAEKQSVVQNAEPSSEQTEESPLTNTETTEEDDTVVITVPENVEEKPVEEESLPPTSDSNDTDVKSVAQEAIAVAGGLGAAAVVLEHAKRELTGSEPEETSEKEEKAEESVPEPSAEEQLLQGEPEKEEMTLTEEVQRFLDRERQHSSYDKVTDVLNLEEQPLNEATETEVVGDAIPGALARMTLPEVKDEETADKAQSGPSDVEAEGDDQERDGSTTSDEIEFEISPLKYPEEDKTTAEAGTHVENDTVNVPAVEEETTEDKTDTTAEPEPNKTESEDQPTTNIEEVEPEPVKVFLTVPEALEEDYPGRAPEDAIQQEGQARSKRSVEPEEIILDCGNIGNEIIQTGEVQKVELIEGDEDILQVHLTTTIETVQESGDSLLVQMTSKIDPSFEVSMETKVESPVLEEKMRLIRAAVVIQNSFRRFRMRKITGEPSDVSTDELDASIVSETKLDLSMQTHLKDASSRESESSFSSSATKINNRDFKGRNLSRSATRTLLETHSLDPIRKITPLKTRSLSSVRYGVADFEVWNQLVKELEEAATKIQSNYRGYKTRKKLQRGNAIQSTTTTSEESTTSADIPEVNHRHTGEFHDSIVLTPPSK